MSTSQAFKVQLFNLKTENIEDFQIFVKTLMYCYRGYAGNILLVRKLTKIWRK